MKNSPIVEMPIVKRPTLQGPTFVQEFFIIVHNLAMAFYLPLQSSK